MPTLPQFFRHFIPKITTAFSSGGRSSGHEKSNDIYASAEQNGHVGSLRAQHQQSQRGHTDAYVELDERRHQFKSIDKSELGPCVWSDEVFTSDEEKALPVTEDNGITRVSRHRIDSCEGLES